MNKYEQKTCAYCGNQYIVKTTTLPSIYSDWCGNCTIDKEEETRYIPNIDAMLQNFRL